MKISNSTPNYINQTYANQAGTNGTNAAQKAVKATDDGKADSINLSSKTLDLQKISKASEIQPEQRTQKLAALKESVEKNQYSMDAEKVADKILGSLMNEII